MSIREIAFRLTELCRKGDFDTALHELYADDAISIEPHQSAAFEQVTRGLPAIIEKGKKFDNMTAKLHGCAVSEPLFTSNSIAFILTMDITMVGGSREKISEICVYGLRDGKIISEQFFL